MVSGRTDIQKILLMVGPRRGGKGTIARILTGLVGADNVAGPTLAAFGRTFGMQSLLGKTLAVLSDSRTSGPSRDALERLLAISGEDEIDIDIKFRAPWTGRLPTAL